LANDQWSNPDKSNGHELNLSSPNTTGQKKKCSGKQFNQAEKDDNGDKCFICGRVGYFVAECWDNPENASKCPTWYKPKAKSAGNEINNASRNKGKVANKFELLFCTVGKQLFPDSLGLLTDSNIWIAKTGATIDTTFDNEHMYAITKPSDADTAKTASTHWLKVVKVGKVNVILCNNQGKEVTAMMMQEAVHTPNTPHNVISINLRLLNGWNLIGDKDAISLVKGQKRVSFDIKIHTV
jgi:hypothetical protein